MKWRVFISFHISHIAINQPIEPTFFAASHRPLPSLFVCITIFCHLVPQFPQTSVLFDFRGKQISIPSLTVHRSFVNQFFKFLPKPHHNELGPSSGFQSSDLLLRSFQRFHMLIQKFLSLKLMAACKHLVQLGPSSGISFTKFRRFSSSEKQFDGSSMIFGSSSSSNSSFNRFDFRQISQLVKPNGKRVFLVDMLALVRRLEAQGVPSKQAEAITAAITEVLNDSLENVAHSFVSKAEMQKTDMLHESNLSKFKTEVQSSQGRNDFEIYDSERTVGHTVLQ